MWAWIVVACSETTRKSAPEARPSEPSAAQPRLEPDVLSLAPVSADRETFLELWQDLSAPRSPADGGGELVLVEPPASLVAGEPCELSLDLVVGAHGIAVGGSVVFLASPFYGWSPPQSSRPGAPGHTLVSGPDGVQFETRELAGMLFSTVRGRALEAGERVRVVYGAGGTARADRFAERSPLWAAVDGDGDSVRELLKEPALIDVRAGPPARVLATVPSALSPGDAFDLVLALTDALGNAPVELAPAQREVSIQAPVSLGLPLKAHLPEDGLLRLQGHAGVPGVYQVIVEGAGLVGASNPLVVREGASPVLWADLQVHTALSDGTGDPDAVLRYAREVAALDAVAITDHDHFGPRFLDKNPDQVERIARATDDAYVPGTFVAVHGYEWTSWLFGHRHVLSFGARVPLLSSLAEGTDTPGELHESLAARPDADKILVIRHHPAGGPVPIDWSFPIDPRFEPVVEITSVHGQSESPSLPAPIYNARREAFIDQQLASGARFGLVGSTDGHDGHPGLSHLIAPSGGLAALIGAERTREGVLAALRERRVYATNGPRILLRVTGNGALMGAVLPAMAPVEIEVRVVGTAPIRRVELVTRAGVTEIVEGTGSALLHATWTLPAPAAGDLAYVRVIQSDGGLAWSSPLLFDQP